MCTAVDTSSIAIRKLFDIECLIVSLKGIKCKLPGKLKNTQFGEVIPGNVGNE